MLITGRFSDYPLPLLLEIFLHRSETGLLEIISPGECGHIYIKDGKLVDAALGEHGGIEAVSFADTLADSSFRFNSLPPAEYAQLVWKNSLESRRRVSPDLHSSAMAVYAGIRQLHVYATTASRSLREILRSTTQSLIARASAAYERQKQATQTGLAVLQRRVADWRTDPRVQQIQVPNERISNLFAVLQRERILSFVRNTQLLSHLKQEPLPRNSFAVITMALLGAMLVMSASHVELRKHQTQTSTTGNESGKLGVESQAQSTLVLSNPSGIATDPRVTGPDLTKKGHANDKGNLQRSVRKIPSENSDTKITKETRSLLQKKTLTSAQHPSRLADDSASAKAQDVPTKAEQTISVFLQIEDGHVSRASVVERRPGMRSYEAAALRIARQRRYPAGTKRTDTVVVKVTNSHSN